MSKVTLEQQIVGLETACQNMEEAIKILQSLDAKQNTLTPKILIKQDHLNELKAALKSLKWLKKHRLVLSEMVNAMKG
jgi:hypothetical protein